jgi:hypothetical protein
MAVTIRYKKGDTVPLQYTIESWSIEKQGTEPYDLTDKTVTFSLYDYKLKEWIINDQPCTVVDAVEGIVNATGLPAVSGMYRAVFKSINEDGEISSFPEYDTQWLWIVDDTVV